jgi:hypothetical protein
MTINGINGVNTQGTRLGLNQAMDSYSRNIQNQKKFEVLFFLAGYPGMVYNKKVV